MSGQLSIRAAAFINLKEPEKHPASFPRTRVYENP